MKKSLSHLPPHKREELRVVAEIIRETVPETAMIILFGSYARGDWVEDVYTEGHITYEYKSDFDILAVAPTRSLANKAGTWRDVEGKARSVPGITRSTIIAHDIEYLNHQLARGQYFFTDIKKEGVMLYDSKQFKLARRRKLDPKERSGIAKADFKQWFTSANDFCSTFEFNLQRRRYKLAAFLLHQATERYYGAVLLVYIHYKPKSHDLEFLGGRAGSCDPEFLRVFPMGTAEQRRRFELLRKAYVDARYNSSYKITRAELKYLAERVQLLRRLTSRLCKKRIASFV